MATYIDGGYKSEADKGPRVPKGMGKTPAGTKLLYGSACVPDKPGGTDGHVVFTETAVTTYYEPAGSEATTAGHKEYEQQVTVITTHTIKSDEKCPKVGKKITDRPYDGDDSKTEFSSAIQWLVEHQPKEDKDEKEESTPPKKK